MNDLVSELQNEFSVLATTYDVMSGKPLPDFMKRAPAFFFDDIIHERTPFKGSMGFEELALPFDCLWLVYRTNNGALGWIDNAVCIHRADQMLKITLFARMHSQWLATPWYATFLTGTTRLTAGWLASQTNPSIAETIPEMIACLAAINAKTTAQDDAKSEPRNPSNRVGRYHRNARFITVRPNAIAPRNERGGGTHASPIGHQRRGHWRTYRSGRRTWVAAMDVNGGGSGQGRAYAVGVTAEA